MGFFGTVFLILGVTFMSMSLQELLMDEVLRMRPWLPVFSEWTNPVPLITLKFYCFNVTNAREFASGDMDQLHLEEVGPVVYAEITRHEDVVFHEENSTLSYTSKKEAVYLEELNEPGILNRTIIIPNLVTLGMASYFKDSNYFVNLGAKFAMNQAGEEAFKEITIYDYLWNYRSEVLTWAKSMTGTLIVPGDNVGVLYTVSTFNGLFNS